MRIQFIRHGDPDYDTDTLTERGRQEASVLADYICSGGITLGDVYVSPLGRARETASYTLKRLGTEENIKEWLKEFPVRLNLEEMPEEIRYAYSDPYDPSDEYNTRHIPWDMLPSYFMSHPELYSPDAWRDSTLARCSGIVSEYDRVTGCFDELLAEHGYVRDGELYRAERPNEDTITFFCHLGITCVFMSHLWHTSPFLFMQNFALATSSVTEVVTEERQKGIASFRLLRAGDITHLNIAGQKPSSSARFCETYDNWDQRH